MDYKTTVRGATCSLAMLVVGGILTAFVPAAAAAGAGCADEQLRSEGNSTALPDCRFYELVSPAEKNGAEIGELSQSPLIQASPEGDAITYYADTPIEAEPAGNPEEDRILSTRGVRGWSSSDISTGGHTGASGGDVEGEFFTFSSNLSLAIVQPQGLRAVSSKEPLYVRNNSDGSYEALVTPANVAPGVRHEIEEHGARGGRIMGASADGAHVVFSSPDNLTGSAPEGGLFEWSQGQLQFISELPTGTAAPYAEDFGGEDRNVRYAISEDGSRVFWEGTESGSAERRLYLRNAEAGSTVRVNASQGIAENGEPAPPTGGWFQAASRTGSVAFFKEDKRLTPESTAAEGDYDLYAYDAEAPEGQRLTDLTVDEHAGEHASVQGEVLGASEDGSYVYFVANGVLATGASPGDCEGEESSPIGATCNLYEAHNSGTGWTTTFIAALSAKDGPDWAEGENAFTTLADLASRVSPNGKYLAFMSQEPLMGYDNTDTVSGQPDEEVYLYDASTDRLTCASCNPTGARPIGVHDSPESELIVDRQNDWREHWLAGSIPGWSGSTATYAGHQPRYLSDSGRLFFDSPEGFVAQDTNDVEDVYEYEPSGVGGCGSGSSSEGVEAYGGDGCLALISGGTGPEESAFVDASEDGNDVFFVTSQALAPADKDTNFDMYDAHVCSTESPCPASTTETASAPCSTAETCRPGESTTQVFGAPSSTLVSGSGNLAPPPATPSAQLKPTPKPLTRAQKLAKALRACQHDRSRRKRSTCETGARKRYRSKIKSRAKKTSVSREAGR